MDRKCDNCKYFRKGSVEPGKHVWGDCLKPREHAWGAQDREPRAFFRLAGESCDDFEPRTAPADQPAQDSL
ncbi:MAG: hypothetical protein PVJ86_09225 [Phycisphaerales bacterium]|jgi:hypothetical protein